MDIQIYVPEHGGWWLTPGREDMLCAVMAFRCAPAFSSQLTPEDETIIALALAGF